MNKYSLTGLLLFFCTCVFSQNAMEILRRSYKQCQSVKSGYYEMSKYMKYMDKQDTVRDDFKCHFRKHKEDTLYGLHFRGYMHNSDGFSDEVIYNGNEFVILTPEDSTALIVPRTQWAEEVRSMCNNVRFYTPLVRKNSSPLLHDSDLTDKSRVYQYLGVERVNGVACDHVQMNEADEGDPSMGMKVLRAEHHYWISRKDLIPVQYSIAFDMAFQNDTQYQYELFVLNHYRLNNLKDDQLFALAEIPAFYKRKDYEPYKSPELLPADSAAPAWSLQNLNGATVSLNGLKGQVVLIDFFYKACAPCMLAIPVLQKLHEKYADKGVVIVGLDPFDKDAGDLKKFLEKRGVTYTVVTSEKELVKQYHVSAFPTIYLIDRNGRIIAARIGYGPGTEAELEALIKKHL